MNPTIVSIASAIYTGQCQTASAGELSWLLQFSTMPYSSQVDAFRFNHNSQNFSKTTIHKMYLHGESRPTFAPFQTINAISRLASRAIQGFNRPVCLPVIQGMLNATSSLANDPSFFYRDKSGRIFSDYSNPIILEDKCVELCGGSGMGWYSDSATRLLTWFVPGLFLIWSINLAPIGLERFVTVAHLFGDPIHSYWSLLSKLEDWNECDRLAREFHESNLPPASRSLLLASRILPPASKFWHFPCYNTPIDEQARDIVVMIDEQARDTAVIIAAIKELLPANKDIDVAAIHYCSCSTVNYNQIAGSIISARTTGTQTTWFAIGTYIFGIICAFIPVLGGSEGDSGPSGGKIAPAMLLSWILPNILLNNEIGQLPKEACIRIVRQLETSEGQQHSENCNATSNPKNEDWTSDTSGLNDDNWKEFLSSQAWSGGIYSCQLQRSMLETRRQGRRSMLKTRRQWRRSIVLVIIAVSAVFTSFGISFAVLYSYPTFFSCRNIMFLGIIVVWLASPFLTHGIMASNLFGSDSGFRWRILVLKDTLIGFSVVLLLILSSCGLGNSCRCWAGFNNGIKGVVLNPGKQFTENNTYIYPALVAICLVLQYLVFKTALYVGRTGLGIMIWSADERIASLPGRAARQEVQAPPVPAPVTVVVPTPYSASEEHAMLGGESGFEIDRYGDSD
jgi:hypothetical protein